MNIFISYNRQTKAVTKALVDDVEALGHTVWFDQELSGGQAWWDQILSMIRRCDLFVFVLDPASLNSIACRREYGYAADLRKPILPILVSEGVSTNILPPSLSQIEFVDYRNQDRTAAFRLARAFSAVPPPAALPDPLPNPPEAPISYLGSLAAKVEATSLLTYEEQTGLLFDLKRGFRDPETADDAQTLLKIFRKRRDLLAGIAEEIDELLEGLRKTPSARGAPPKLEQVTGPINHAPQETKVQFNRDLLIFVSKWTLACLLGEAVGRGVASATFELTRSYTFFLLVQGAGIGVAVGFTQWVLLRGRIDYSQWWILVTTIGWALQELLPLWEFRMRTIGPLMFGGILGIMQWLVLRRSVSRAAWWILIVSIAEGLGWAAGAMWVVHWYSLLWGIIHGAVSGVITGFGLGILLQRAEKGLGPLKQTSSTQ